MTMPDVLQWRTIDAKDSEIAGYEIETFRARVPGGWLLAVMYLPVAAGDGKTLLPGGTTFVPDPNNEWTGTVTVRPSASRAGPLGVG